MGRRRGMCTNGGGLSRGVDLLFRTPTTRWELPNMVYTHFGFLLWIAVAVTALCYVLARALLARVRALQEMRLSADLGGNAIRRASSTEKSPSTCMTARCRHCWPRGSNWTKRGSECPRSRVGHGATPHCRKPRPDCAQPSRSWILEVLAELGLTPAVRELVRQFESRTDLVVEADLDDVGKPASQAAAVPGGTRSCSPTCGKHAKATTVRIGLDAQGRPHRLDRLPTTTEPASIRAIVGRSTSPTATYCARLAAGGLPRDDGHRVRCTPR